MFGLWESHASCALDGRRASLDDAYVAFLARTGPRPSEAVEEILSDRWAAAIRIDRFVSEPPTPDHVDRIARLLEPGRRNAIRRHTRMREPETPSLVTARPLLGEGRIRRNLKRLLVWTDAPATPRLFLEVRPRPDARSGPRMDPLLTAAVLHARILELHPYRHANGRLARLLSTMHLVRHGLLNLPILGLNRWLLDHEDEYLSRLRAVCDDGAWEPWLTFFLGGVERAASDLARRIGRRERLRDETFERLTAGGGDAPFARSRVDLNRLLDVVFRFPYVGARHLGAAGVARRQTAARHLRTSTDLGLLSPRPVGTEVLYRNEALLDLLEEPPADPHEHDALARPARASSIPNHEIDEAKNRPAETPRPPAPREPERAAVTAPDRPRS